MPVSLDDVQTPLRKLRKSLKKLPKDSSADDVHKLRTQTRRMEAIVSGLALDRKNGTHRLLKAVKPVRKSAGDVRDMDVLEGKALTLSSKGDSDSLVRLMEHLGGMRIKGSHDLYDQVAKRRTNIRRRLKKLSKLVENRLTANRLQDLNHGSAAAGKDGEGGFELVAVALRLAEQLSRWPALDRRNVHPFRVKAKKLRYVLQLTEDSNTEFVEVLGEVKDAIGDWHDWLELLKIAADVLDRDVDRAVLKQIESMEKAKLKEALVVANRLRNRFLSSETSPNKARNQTGLHRAVLETAVKLGA